MRVGGPLPCAHDLVPPVFRARAHKRKSAAVSGGPEALILGSHNRKMVGSRVAPISGPAMERLIGETPKSGSGNGPGGPASRRRKMDPNRTKNFQKTLLDLRPFLLHGEGLAKADTAKLYTHLFPPAIHKSPGGRRIRLSDQSNAGQLYTLDPQCPGLCLVLPEQGAGARSHSMLIVGQTTTLGHVIPRYYGVGSTQGLWARSTLRTPPPIYLSARGSEHDILEVLFHAVVCVASSQRNPPSARIPQPVDS